MTAGHPCAVAHCGEPTARRLLCQPHWRTVPAELRRHLFATWRRLGANRAIPSGQSPWDDYERARRAVVAAAVTAARR